MANMVAKKYKDLSEGERCWLDRIPHRPLTDEEFALVARGARLALDNLAFAEMEGGDKVTDETAKAHAHRTAVVNASLEKARVKFSFIDMEALVEVPSDECRIEPVEAK